MSVPETVRPGLAYAWPSLPCRGFVTGRAALRSDIACGDAVFAAVSGPVVIGRPLAVTVPQYAYLRSTRQRGVLVQAEAVGGMRAFGFRTLDGGEIIATDGDLELLGVVRPD